MVILITVVYKNRKSGWRHLLALTFFGFYLLIVSDIIIFPILIPENWPANLNVADTLRALQQINWRPFYFDVPASSVAYPGANMRHFQWFDIVGNILLTIPLGLGMAYFTRMNTTRAAWVALAVGSLFEGTQLLIKLTLGVYYHTVDVNDVIWNTLGFLLGYGTFQLMGIFHRDKSNNR